MAFVYRVAVFGKPRGPWRGSRRQAQQDAIDIDLGEYDEWGAFWVMVPGEIESRRCEEVRLSA